MHQYPPYYISNKVELWVVSDIWQKNYNIEEPHLGYSNVAEVNQDGSYTIYTFSDYTKNADKLDVRFKWLDSKKVTLLNLVSTNVNRVSSASALRGHLIEKKEFDSSGKLVKEGKYFYRGVKPLAFRPMDGDDPQQDKEITSFRPIMGGAMSKKITLRHTPLVSNSEKTGSVKEEKNSYFNQYDLVKRTEELTSDNSYIKKYYLYSCDKQSLISQAVQGELLDNNIINLLLQEKITRNDVTISTQNNLYELVNHKCPILHRVQEGKGTALPETRTTYANHSNKGRIFSSIKDKSEKIVYVWGYKSQYIVAKVVNADISEVTSILGDLNTFADLLTPDAAKIDQLRSKLPRAQVTSFAYTPLIGVTCVTDPRGLSTWYEYDQAGRLIRIKDSQENVLMENEYNYGK